ncbi:NADPH-dependent F420 reductase [Thauera sp. JM12B12]|uniref:NADPH-dependent F420 reductase n=1 Tax=Thauera sp. JM12B12 TaxID=3142262 RepID=UPI0031F3CF0E
MEQTIAVVGGTGNLGAALARRWAKAGKKVIIGSRTAEKAREAAISLGAGLDTAILSASNLEAACAADIVVTTVPFSSQAAVLEEIRPALAGKILIDTTVPLMPPKVARVQLPAEGSAAQRARQLVGETVRVVSAFHNVAAHKLATDQKVECDVLVFGDDKEARAVAVALADCAGLRGLHAGVLANSAAAEALTSILIFLNKTYKVDGAGIRITGRLDRSAAAE